MTDALRIHVTGIVQGVGFRPFVYRLAKKYLISGWVLNATDGVHIHAEGESALVDEFVLELSEHAPAAAQVKEITLTEVPLEDFTTFEIRQSEQAAVQQTTLVSPDLATCADCERELFDPADRRFRYPFINCTNCGPRFTIIDRLPYDRPRTSMKAFPMCEACAQEYANPADRRFHAQPDACWDCGPKVSWSVVEPRAGEAAGAGASPAAGAGASPSAAPAAGAAPATVAWGTTRAESDAIFAAAVDLLKRGGIVAVKGLGGFHLACDADNPQAVATLRQRKARDGKAFAVMMADCATVRTVCEVSPEEEKLLTGAVRPIVLLHKRADAQLAPGVADHLPELGVMLPYTPVQHLLLHDFAAAGGRMLVMTSGNVHDEPIETDDDQARQRLAGVADAFLGNSRPVLSRFDDSVVRVLDFGAAGTAVQVLRRARGYAPAPITLGEAVLPARGESPCVLAVGPEQKSTVCLLRGNQAFVSQHVGDLENAETYDAWLQAKDRLTSLFQETPTLLAFDMHPEYLSSKWAAKQSTPRANVQHHHAHVVAALAEAGVAGPVCGFAFDGTGYGVDGAVWGGEVLLANCENFERFANLAYVPMPGGAAAVKNPLRMAYGVLWAYDLLEHPAAASALEQLGQSTQLLDAMIEQGLNTPYTSSAGRLFDALSALLGICPHPTYEGEAAIRLEAAAAPGVPFDERYALAVVKNQATETSTAQDTSVLLLDAAPAFAAALDDLAAGVDPGVIAARFHQAFAAVVVQVAQLVQALYGVATVALTGGVFMNRTLMEAVVPALANQGFTVVLNKELPPNDGGVSLGQAVIAWHAATEQRSEENGGAPA
ncbi:MAG: carbamoyltransferase HypF [Coriobacteriia bacterium]|nr:carbamoyltransferase HypF [Coriobacteriia bacterium]